MYVSIEGVSHTGKTTLVENLKKMDQRIVIMKGHGQINVGMGKDWEDYNFEMHRILSRLVTLNPDKIFVHDRGFTHSVYHNSDFIPVYACYDDPLVIILTASRETLEKRGSNDTQAFNYDQLDKRFKTVEVDTGNVDADIIAKSVYNFIMKEYERRNEECRRL